MGNIVECLQFDVPQSLPDSGEEYPGLLIFAVHLAEAASSLLPVVESAECTALSFGLMSCFFAEDK